jgi:hypothetical protein
MRTNAKAISQLELPTHLTAAQCLKAIHALHSDPLQWAVFDEFYPGTGTSSGSGTRLDTFVVNCWPSGGYVSVAYEIKVSRQDFINELKQPAKRRFGLLISNQFYFVTPVGLLTVDEIPVECGLREVMPDLSIRHTKTAPHRERLPASWALLAAVARRVGRLEQEA